MKADSKERYVSAMREHAKRKTLGATEPVVVDAYRFFDEACSRFGLDHTFMKGDRKRIIDLFTDAFSQACTSDDVGFPIIVHKVNQEVVEIVKHGKQAAFDEDRTPAAYVDAATTRSNNPHAGWALFGTDSNKTHPIVSASFSQRKKRIETSTSNFNKQVRRIAPDLLIGSNGSDQKRITA